MKHVLLALTLLQSILSYTQCAGTQSATLSPPPPAGGYLPNTTVNVCYTMNGWPGLSVGANWLEGFSITVGPGWNAPQPVSAPADCNGGTTTGWLWMNSVTSTATGQTAGPGYFYEGPTGPQDNNPGNDWGDQGNCSWTMCFSVTTKQSCLPLNLNLSVTAGADGTWGSWSNASCPTTPYSVYTGSLKVHIVTVASTVKKDTCGLGLGSIQVVPSSTTYTGPYTYTWTPNVGNTAFIGGLTAGTYSVQIGYNNGCIKTASYVVGNVQPTYAATSTIVSCYGDATGTATATMTPPIGNISYNWSNTQTTQTATGLVAGPYTCTISNTIGCTSTVPVTVTQNPQLLIQNLLLTNATCADSDAIISYNAVGGVIPYQYALNGVASTNTEDSLAGGNYLIHVTDALSCTRDSLVTLLAPTALTPSIVPDVTLQCAPGTFTFTNTSSPAANIASTIYDWGDGTIDTTNIYGPIQHIYNTPGTWNILVSLLSDYGCTYTDTMLSMVETTQPPIANFVIQPNPTTTYTTHVTCSDWSSEIPTVWEWSAPGATPTNISLQQPWFMYPELAGEYYITLKVTDYLGCWDTITHKLIIEDEMLVFVPNTFTPNGDEWNNKFQWTILGINDALFRLQIWNRWGELIWETRDPYSYWDGSYNGKLAPEGIYTWTMLATNKIDAGKRTFIGSINIIK
jgi:gliding motility-associated-like protein